MATRARASTLTLVLVVIGFLVVSAASAVAILLYTPWGRERVCSILNRAVTKQIAGQLRVEHLDALSLGRAHARGIKIIAPGGLAAIEADSAVIDFSIPKLLAGEYGWSRAEIDHCLVRVSQDEHGRVNMEETFKKRSPSSESADTKSKTTKDQLDLQNMVTSNCTLLIYGKGLPSLHMKQLAGIMRVHVLGNGDTELRFDEYKGTFAKGLPTGVLDFHDVRGEVVTATKRLLQFEGSGRTHDAEVDFSLDIFTEPKKLVKIEANFPEPSAGSVSTLFASLWSKFSEGIDIAVNYGQPRKSHESRKTTGS